MSAKQTDRRNLSALLVLVVVILTAAALTPGFATFIGRMVANLWVTVMSAVAGLLGGFFGS